MRGLVDVVDNLAEVGLEVGLGQVLQVGERCRGNVSLPLEVTFAGLDHIPDVLVLLAEGSEGLGELEFVAGDGTSTSGESQILLLLLGTRLPGQVSGLPHVGREHDQIEVLVDVVHDLRLEESLGSVVHDLVTKLGLGDVLSELLGSSSVGKSIDELLHHLELSSEQRILLRVHVVPVHLEEVQVDSRHSLHETLEGGVDLELFEEAGNHTASGGSGESDLVVDDDGSVDVGSDQSLADGVEVHLVGGSRVTDGNSDQLQPGEVLLGLLHDSVESLQLLHLNLLLLLADVDDLELAVVLGSSLQDSEKLRFIFSQHVSGDAAELSVLPDLVAWSRTHGVAVDIDVWLLADVEPDDLPVLG